MFSGPTVRPPEAVRTRTDGRWHRRVPELIIAGFHRSGTSLVSELLNRAGLFLGDDLIGAHPTNPYGHFEDRDFTRFHDALLADNQRSWHITAPFIPVITQQRWQQ